MRAVDTANATYNEQFRSRLDKLEAELADLKGEIALEPEVPEAVKDLLIYMETDDETRQFMFKRHNEDVIAAYRLGKAGK